MQYAGKFKLAFTLVELLVVIAVISLLMGILMPALSKIKALAAEKLCASNLRQVNFALVMYAQDDSMGRYPLAQTEHNDPCQGSHLNLLMQLGTDKGCGPVEAFYCPKSRELEKFASNPTYVPKGDIDSVIDTPENRRKGLISYVYWSFKSNKYCPFASGSKKHWRNPTFFLPRQLTLTGIESHRNWLGPPEGGFTQANQDQRYLQCIKAPPSNIWVMSDFFRRGAPFPHTRKHARGLNVIYLDGHVDLILGKPRDNYR